MANISTYLQMIMEAIYGEEVRSSIYNSLVAMNAESTKAMEFASDAKDSAQAFAAEAADSASTAAISEGNAKTSEQNAAVSEKNVNDAKSEVLSAKSDVMAAKNDAETANEDAQKAKQDAEKAKQDAEKAKQDAENAQNGAKAAAENAANSATEASESALAAKQYSGKPPKPDPDTKTWWIWDADRKEYVDSHIGSEIEGPQGVGIENIKLTTGDHTPGTVDIYTIELSDGSSYNISVWNGRNGEGAGDVLGKSFDLIIPASGWSDGQITIADDRLLALPTYKYFIGAFEASRDEFLECGIQPKDITATGFITFTNETAPTEDIMVSVVRFELSSNG